MALKFNCENCSSIIYSKFLKIGEGAKCKNCGSVTTIPENAEIISESDIPEKLDNSEKHDNGPTQIKSNIKDKKSELKNRSGYKGKANSPFFHVVQFGMGGLFLCQIIGVFGIGVMIKQFDVSPIYGFIVISIFICGVIVLMGLSSLIDVVRVLETDMENLHQEKNNG
tara:strand:- start:87 stop:590 length:504 start_codon:yes stop_codon:yes gene_type:complete